MLCSLRHRSARRSRSPRSLRRLLRDGRQPDWRSSPRHSGRATAGGSRQRAGSKGIKRSIASRAAVENHMIGNGSQNGGKLMRICRQWLVLASCGLFCCRQRTGCEGNHRQAVQTELAASRDDQSHWLYYEVPSASVTQWWLRRATATCGACSGRKHLLSLPAQHASLIALSRIRRRRPGSAKPASMTTSRRRRC